MPAAVVVAVVVDKAATSLSRNLNLAPSQPGYQAAVRVFTLMNQFARWSVCLILLFWLLSASSLCASPCSTTLVTPSTSPSYTLQYFAAAPRWWDETVQWVRNLGWDRGRLVQLWLLFMLLGLYVILRIKPRA